MKSGTLHFADYIKKLPSAWVFEQFIKASDASRKILSSSMIDEAVARFSTAEVLQKRFQALSPSNQLTCSLVYLTGSDGLSSELEHGLNHPLILSFLVYAGKNESGAIRFFGFDEFESHLRARMVQVILNAASVQEKHANPQWVLRSLNDITAIASLGAQGVLKKKRSGGLTRAASMQIKKLTDTGTSQKSESGDYIPRMVIAYCMKKGVMIQTDNAYETSVPALSSWLSRNRGQLHEEFLEFVFAYTGGWRRTLMEKLLTAGKDTWISSTIFPEADRKRVNNTLRAFRFSGLIELKNRNSELIFTRVKTIGPQDIPEPGSVMVLPDFSGILPQEIDPLYLFRFAQVGVIASLDRIYKGRIDRTVLNDSMSRGGDGGTFLGWLSEWHAPGNVLETVKEWLREFNRLYITDGSMLISNDERVTKQIESFEPLRSLLQPVSAHAFYTVKKGSEEKIRELLKNLGFDHRMPGQEHGAVPGERMYEEEPSPERWEAIIEPESGVAEVPGAMRGTKYGRELKRLDANETVHVIDYAILTGQNLIFEYEGSPYVKQNTYTVIPHSCQKGIEPMFEGELLSTHSRKQFYVKKIRRIGVLSR